jgi:hypothetical protein
LRIRIILIIITTTTTTIIIRPTFLEYDIPLLFVAEKITEKKKGEMREGERRIDNQVIN